MDNCYHNKTELEAKAQGLKPEEAYNKTESYINKYEVNYNNWSNSYTFVILLFNLFQECLAKIFV
jgi:hypothetical protein